MNTTTTDINTYLYGYSTHDIELANLIQSGLSLIATIIILLKITNPLSIFKSVRERQRKHSNNKKRKELLRLEELIKQVQNGVDANIEELLSEDSDEMEKNKGVLRIAHKKKNKNLETKV